MAQKIESPREKPSTDAGGALHFEGTVNLGGPIGDGVLSVLFGPESTVDGKLRFDGAVRIDGAFSGAIKTNDALIVGDSARVEAEIDCGSAVVSGEVTGNITATDSVELASTARLKGDVTAPAFSVAKGAMFDGAARMDPASRRRAAR